MSKYNHGLSLPENSFGIGVTQTQDSGTIGTYQVEDVGAGGGGGPAGLPKPPNVRPIPRPPGACACTGPGSSGVKQVQVLRNNIYKIQ